MQEHPEQNENEPTIKDINPESEQTENARGGAGARGFDPTAVNPAGFDPTGPNTSGFDPTSPNSERNPLQD